MAYTVVLPLSDAAIGRLLHDNDVYQLRDEKNPLILRYNKARTAGSWYVIKYSGGSTIWRKIGKWPMLTTKAVLARLPEILAQLAVDDRSEKVRIGQLQTTGQVLMWYLNRATGDRNLSDSRKSQLKTAIKKHLIPRIGLIPLDKLNRKVIDHKLLWPMQGDYALSTVRLAWSALKRALNQAETLELIKRDPTAGMKFTDFITAPILPKGSRLRADQVDKLLHDLTSAEPRLQLLVLLMLMHGTRIGETLAARWSDFSSDWWNIPAENTKTKNAHRLPLTDTAKALLEAHRAYATSAHVFPGDGSHWSGTAASRAIRKHSNQEWSAHDLRKLARTIWTDIGVEYLIGELLLNHSLSKLDKTYIHTYADQQTKAALTKYHEWLKSKGLTALVNRDSTEIGN